MPTSSLLDVVTFVFFLVMIFKSEMQQPRPLLQLLLKCKPFTVGIHHFPLQQAAAARVGCMWLLFRLLLWISSCQGVIKTFLHFSDVHLNLSLPNAHYGTDSSIALFESALRYASSVVPNPDLVLYTGDHSVHESLATEELYQVVDTNVRMITQHFHPNSTFTSVIGNSDSGTCDTHDRSKYNIPIMEMQCATIIWRTLIQLSV